MAKSFTTSKFPVSAIGPDVPHTEHMFEEVALAINNAVAYWSPVIISCGGAFWKPFTPTFERGINTPIYIPSPATQLVFAMVVYSDSEADAGELEVTVGGATPFIIDVLDPHPIQIEFLDVADTGEEWQDLIITADVTSTPVVETLFLGVRPIKEYFGSAPEPEG